MKKVENTLPKELLQFRAPFKAAFRLQKLLFDLNSDPEREKKVTRTAILNKALELYLAKHGY